MPRFRKGTLDHDGDGKTGGSMKETDVTKKAKKAAHKKPVETQRAPEDQVIFLRGRHARGAGIRREDSPYLGHERDVWLEGYDGQEA